jgi:Arm DNA-binding domain/Phage integrase, N-terminal SAM-like domain
VPERRTDRAERWSELRDVDDGLRKVMRGFLLGHRATWPRPPGTTERHAAWKCIYSRHGRPRWYSIGRADAIGLADARKLAAKVMVKVADGQDPQADRKAERTSGTFEELAVKYADYAEHRKKRNKSWQKPDALVKKHLLPHWGKLKVTNIKRSDVKAVMAKIKAKIVANQVLAAASNRNHAGPQGQCDKFAQPVWRRWSEP